MCPLILVNYKLLQNCCKMSLCAKVCLSVMQDTYRRRQMQRTVTRQMSFDLTKLLVTEDWFSDISPQTMRRLLNIVSVTGLLPSS